jgi:hypothetical protein
MGNGSHGVDFEDEDLLDEEDAVAVAAPGSPGLLGSDALNLAQTVGNNPLSAMRVLMRHQKYTSTSSTSVLACPLRSFDGSACPWQR